jgi:hypothetical protein
MLPILAFLIASPAQVTPPPTALKQRLGLDAFYTKYVDCDGFPTLSSKNVPDKALLRASEIIKPMLQCVPKAKDQMVKNKVRLVVMGEKELTTQIPEHAFLKSDKNTNWDQRARGLGATIQVPVVSCAEENILHYPSDRYIGESILVHEFSHAIMDTGLAFSDKSFLPELQKLFDQAKERHLWENTYAMTNIHEFWAENVQSYFDCNRTASPPDGIHNEIGTRTQLAQYHPEMYEFLHKIFPTEWRYSPPKSDLSSELSAGRRNAK